MSSTSSTQDRLLATLSTLSTLGLGVGLGVALGAALWRGGGHGTAASPPPPAPTAPAPPPPAPPRRAPAPPPPAAFSTAPAAAAAATAAAAARAAAEDPALLLEQLSRTAAYFGEGGQAAIARARVVVVGVGGVGSHAAHMLARAGVGRLRLVDFDLVSLSSLNRHATAARADVGTPKVAALAGALARIAPPCAVEAVQALFCAERAEELLLLEGGASPDYVLDCIDDRDTKVALLSFCRARGLRVLASMGAGGKSDPTRLRFCDLALLPSGAMDPLGAAIKAALRKAGMFSAQYHEGGGDARVAAAAGGGGGAAGAGAPQPPPLPALSGITCLFSAEEPRAGLLPLPPAHASASAAPAEPSASAALANPAELGALEHFRVRIMPVLGTTPALFGQAMAAYALCALAGGAHDLAARAHQSPGHAPGSSRALLAAWSAWEYDRYPRGGGWGTQCGVSGEEVDFVVGEVWHGRSALSHLRLGVRGVRLQLCRWRPWAPSLPSNLALLTDDEAEAVTAAAGSGGVWALAEAAVAAGADFNAGGGCGGGGGSGSASGALEEALEAAWRAAVLPAVGGALAFEAVEQRLAWARARWGR